MKNNLLLIVAIACTFWVNAQDAKTVFNTNEVVWFGLDFSHAKMKGIPDASIPEMKEHWLNVWNDASAFESGTSQLASAFQKLTVHLDLGITEKRNSNANMRDLDERPGTPLSKSIIEQIVSEYPLGEWKKGLGLVFIVEYYSKGKGEGVVWATFFDIPTHKVLLTKQVSGRPRGPGLKLYWHSVYLDILTQVASKYYDMWKKEAGG